MIQTANIRPDRMSNELTIKPRNSYKILFTNFNFMKLWLAQVFSQLAANILNFALIIRVFDLAVGTKYASISVSLLVLAFGVPSIIFALLAGAYVDHMDRKKVLIVANLIRAVLVVGFLFFDTNLVMIYGLVFVISIFSQFFIPAEAAAMPRVVDSRDLAIANSLFLFTLYGSFALGYALAGPAISAWGHNAVYWVAASSFLLATVLCIRLPKIHVASKRLDFGKINHQVIVTIGTTTRKIVSTPRLLFPIINLTIIQMMIGVVAVIAPAIALLLFGQNLASVSGRMIIPAAIGMLMGAAVVGYWLKKAGRIAVIDIGFLLVVGVLIGAYFLPHLKESSFYHWIITIGLLLIGFAAAIISVTAQTLLQTNSSDEERGKIFGTLNMMMNLAASIPVLLAGIIADILSPLSVLAISGVLIGVYGIYQFLTMRKHEQIYRKNH